MRRPHYNKQIEIIAWILTIGGLIAIAVLMHGCTTPRRGCPSTNGFSGYSYCPSCPTIKQLEKSKKIPYIFNEKTRVVYTLDSVGEVVCFYFK